VTIIKISDKLRLASKQSPDHRTIVEVGPHKVGGERVVVIAGPCSVESRDQLMETARIVKEAGCHMLRGGAFKPRTLPYSFQGLGEEGLEILAEARKETGLPVVTEVLTPGDVELVESYADVLQIGARNMQNYALLRRVGASEKPVLLKRGMAATVEEWLGCAEYILNEGNRDVILCERGIRGFSKVTRNTLDVSAVPVIHQSSHLPVIIDPSHGTGVRSLVTPMASAGVAAGADGVMVEVHPRPEEALSDGDQSLRPPELMELMNKIGKVANAVGRSI
jgi:3-deoxy-7-phosphoheptulonate synthase